MRLGVNVDHIATLRQARRGRLPDPVEAARICLRAGATGIVCHLREDRRHIQDEDVRRLKDASPFLNLEMSIAPEVVKTALAAQPAQVTLVPERRQELTTEGGLDIVRLARRLRPVVRAFRQRHIAVSLFIEPAAVPLEAARGLGVEIVELHTGRYANAGSPRAQARELDRLRQAAVKGRELGLAVAAGHGLDYENAQAVAEIAQIEELNIGFAIITRAVFVGLEQAVSEMVSLLVPERAEMSHVR